MSEVNRDVKFEPKQSGYRRGKVRGNFTGGIFFRTVS